MDEQMYREVIRTLEFMKKAYENLDANAAGMGRLVGAGFDCPVRIKTYGELYQYHAAVMQIVKEALEEVQQYQAVGTVQECREAMEKQKEKRPVILNEATGNADGRMYAAEHFKCPACSNESVYFGGLPKHCQNCGQKLKGNSK